MSDNQGGPPTRWVLFVVDEVLVEEPVLVWSVAGFTEDPDDLARAASAAVITALDRATVFVIVRDSMVAGWTTDREIALSMVNESLEGRAAAYMVGVIGVEELPDEVQAGVDHFERGPAPEPEVELDSEDENHG